MNELAENRKLQIVLASIAGWLLFVVWKAGLLTSGEEGLLLAESYSSGSLGPLLYEAMINWAKIAGCVWCAMWLKLIPNLDVLAEKLDDKIDEWQGNDEPEQEATKPATKGNNNKLIIIALIAFGAWHFGLLDGLIGNGGIVKPVRGKPKAVLFLVNDTLSPEQISVTSSGILDEKLVSSGIERRRLQLGADAGTAEEWVEGAIEADQGELMMVCWYGGKKFVLSAIPKSVEEVENYVRIR